MSWMFKRGQQSTELKKMNFIFAKTIHVPNPIWWIAGYGFVYPYRYIKHYYRLKFPKKIPPNICDICGSFKDPKDLWPFCSPECIELMNKKYQKEK